MLLIISTPNHSQNALLKSYFKYYLTEHFDILEFLVYFCTSFVNREQTGFSSFLTTQVIKSHHK